MRVSVVTSLYYSSPYTEEFYRRATKSVQEITDDYEIIFVNDGSPDDSLKIAISLYEKDKRVKVVDLSRNFGHHKALITGLAHATGDLIFLIDSDLEEEPEILAKFYQELNNQKVDVIYGVQISRKGNSFERISGQIYYVAFNLLTGYKASANVLTARLMTKDYVRALVKHREREFDIMGLWSLTGFEQRAVAVDKLSKGSTVYSMRRKLSLFVNTVTAFSSRPLFAIFFLGLFVCALSIVSILFSFVKRIFITQIDDLSFVTFSIWFVGGLIITCLGIIGIYVSKMNIEIKQRPYTIVRKFYGIEPLEN